MTLDLYKSLTIFWHQHPGNSHLTINTMTSCDVDSYTSIVTIKWYIQIVRKGIILWLLVGTDNGIAHVHSRTHAHTHTHMHACMHTHTHTLKRACTHTHTKIHTHTHMHMQAYTQLHKYIHNRTKAVGNTVMQSTRFRVWIPVLPVSVNLISQQVAPGPYTFTVRSVQA